MQVQLPQVSWLVAALAALLFVSPGQAQPPGGFRGGGGFGPGGGGDRGGFSRMGDFMRRMDANGNGMLEPDEIPDRMRGFLESRLRDAGLDPNGPVSLEKLEQMRRDRERRDDDDDRRRGDEDRRDRDDDRRSGGEDAKDAPLVPGFGNEFLDSPVAAFGPIDGEDSAWQAAFDPRQLDRARDTLRRYDRNKDGVIDRSEWQSTSRWRTDPNESDLNKDGRLTLKELAGRYSSFESNRDDGDGRSRFSSRGSWFGRRDDDSGRGEDRSPPSDARSSSSSNSKARFDTRSTYKLKTPTERLPRGLDDWFARQDSNADGQVTMAEFASSWNDALVAEFRKLDLNGDGVVTAAESLSGPKVTLSGRSSAPSSSSAVGEGSQPVAAADSATQAASTSSTSGGSSSGGDRYSAYVQSYIARRDKNSNGTLEGEELTDVRDSEKIDQNRDRKITESELLEYYRRK